ncbi:DUF397 domain-containing protein [Streptosporangium algeriense]|uniref:DUF397 domain-containing protein n=1 Tax=Streptosporangium algeriense TaxID=1682748 RepID=A0ABW3DNH9_9ACTN
MDDYLTSTGLSKAVWKKSSLSGNSGGNCVEVANLDAVVAVRDSKDPSGSVLNFTADQWSSFVGGIKRGDFNNA